MNDYAAESACKSVFKEGENRAGRYTRIWVTLINQMERNKQVLAGAGAAQQRFPAATGSRLGHGADDAESSDLLPPV